MTETKKQAREQRGYITAAVLRAIAAVHPKPLVSADAGRVAGLTKCTVNQVSASMNKAGKAGYCYTYRSGKGATMFAFINAEACEQYGAEQIKADELQLVRDRNIKHTARANRAIPQGPGVPANVVIAKPSRTAWAVREADASGAKVIVCPAPAFTARYQYRIEAPDERWPSFAAAGIGRYL